MMILLYLQAVFSSCECVLYTCTVDCGSFSHTKQTDMAYLLQMVYMGIIR